MKLFELDHTHNVVIAPEIRMIPEFGAIIKRDKDRDKKRALKELAFVYFYTDYKSDCSAFEEEVKFKEACILSGVPSDFKMDEVIKKAIAFYDEKQITIPIKMLQAAKLSCNKLINLLISYCENVIKSFITFVFLILIFS